MIKSIDHHKNEYLTNSPCRNFFRGSVVTGTNLFPLPFTQQRHCILCSASFPPISYKRKEKTASYKRFKDILLTLKEGQSTVAFGWTLTGNKQYHYFIYAFGKREGEKSFSRKRFILVKNFHNPFIDSEKRDDGKHFRTSTLEAPG